MTKKTLTVILVIMIAAVTLGAATFFTVKMVTAQDAGKSGQPGKNDEKITSAEAFFAQADVIIDASLLPDDLKYGNNTIIQYKGRDYYLGYTPNMIGGGKFAMRILTSKESDELLSAPDIDKITYFQSECLTKMLRWDNVSVDRNNVNTNIVRSSTAHYYRLEDRTVVIVNDISLMALEKVAGSDPEKAFIAVVARGEEDGCSFRIPPEGYKPSDETGMGPYYREVFESFKADYADIND